MQKVNYVHQNPVRAELERAKPILTSGGEAVMRKVSLSPNAECLSKLAIVC